MINVFVQSALVNEAELLGLVNPKLTNAVMAGAKIGKEAHEEIVKEWSHQPTIEVLGPKQDGDVISADVQVTDSPDSWWEAVNFGSVSPGVSYSYMLVGPYDAFSQPGDPRSGPGEKSYDGIIASRKETTIAARDFIGEVIKDKEQAIIDAMTKALG